MVKVHFLFYKSRSKPEVKVVRSKKFGTKRKVLSQEMRLSNIKSPNTIHSKVTVNVRVFVDK